jgi:hypothetical protein
MIHDPDGGGEVVISAAGLGDAGCSTFSCFVAQAPTTQRSANATARDFMGGASSLE